MRVPSWRSVAIELASRLVYTEGCTNPEHEAAPDPNGCPWCADAEAMNLYRRKLESER